MKPVWEETWDVDHYGGVTLATADAKAHTGAGDLIFATFHNEDLARAKLAAQAPAMARLLLEEWLGMTDGERKGSRLDTVLRDAGVLP